MTDAQQAKDNTPTTPSETKKPLEENFEDGEKVEKQGDKSSDSEGSEQGEESIGTPEAEDKSKGASQPSSTSWQAIWSPQYNAYYFYNAETQETTWTNPLQPEEPAASSSSAPIEPAEPESPEAGPSTSAAASHRAALEAAALAQGIDPSLAYLDPSLVQSIGGAPIPGSLPPSFSAKFNARTGQFARPDARDPTHLSEFERAKRMSQFYFDVNAWETEVAQRHAVEAEEEAAGTKKRKRPSKKDLERFKEQKKQKKIAKTAWLRT
ncbi:hypothetical protein BDN72DRAFT_757513 [Pluteus cervinus]|uniref:Uncharacterized protein n=1 Tax=Pluteus cervinus TaxID=181527 RepID=A0ACD3BBW6_9AGAR|nr:hypothetical protein BDN72DRAFT_757513 [Pluteus cervinus]